MSPQCRDAVSVMQSPVFFFALNALLALTHASRQEKSDCLANAQQYWATPEVVYECGHVPMDIIDEWITSCFPNGQEDAGKFSFNKFSFAFAQMKEEHFQRVEDIPIGDFAQAACPDLAMQYTQRATFKRDSDVRPAVVDGELDTPTKDTELENVVSTLNGTKKVTIVYPFYHSAEQLCLYAHAAVATTCYSNADGWFDVLAHTPELGRVASILQEADSAATDIPAGPDGSGHLFFYDVQAAMGLVYGYGEEGVESYLDSFVVEQCHKLPDSPDCKKLQEYQQSHDDQWTPEGALERAKEWLRARGLVF